MQFHFYANQQQSYLFVLFHSFFKQSSKIQWQYNGKIRVLAVWNNHKG